jgi:NADH:ubiquinone oxidoreductase subunit F (NADH-binding)
MPVGQMIAIGVGSPADITQLVLTGLLPGVTGGNGTPLYGVPTTLNADTIYSLPPRVVNIEWYCSVASILEGSVDGSTWITLDSNAGSLNKLVTGVAAVFIRPSDSTIVNVKKKAKL